MVETYLTSIDQLFSDKRDLSTLELRFRSALVELYDGTQLHISEDMLAHFSDAVQAIKQGKSAHIEIDEDLVTAERAGEILGVSRQTIYNWQDKGRLRKIMQGCRRMTSSAEVREKKEPAAAGKRLAEQILSRRTEPESSNSLLVETLRSREPWIGELVRIQTELRHLAKQAGVMIDSDSEEVEISPAAATIAADIMGR
jgi:hypothetical protein